LIKELAMWSKNDTKEISQFLAMDVTIQVALYTVFVSVKRCHIWPLPCALSSLMSMAIFLAIARVWNSSGGLKMNSYQFKETMPCI